MSDTATTALAIRELQPADVAMAAVVLARAMRDNPINVRVFAIADSERRTAALIPFFRAVLRIASGHGTILAAFSDGALAGVCAVARPRCCQPTFVEKARLSPVLLARGTRTLVRVVAWTQAWADRDLPEPHWHLGPVAVAPEFQGRGIGGAMLAEFCANIAGRDEPSWLETDKPENVAFYRRFGFEVRGEADVLGVPCSFMERPATT